MTDSSSAKKASKKKVTKMKVAKKKAVSKKTEKLGHDPLSWIDEERDVTDSSVEKSEVENEVVEEKKEPVNEVKKEEVESAIIENTEDINMLELPSYFGIAQVAIVQEEMKDLLKTDVSEIEIKAEDVESIDTAALQLLLVFVTQVKNDGKSIKWISHSDKLTTAASILNITNELNLAA